VLAANGVETVFGVLSVHMLDLYDALVRDGRICLLVPRHEQAAVHMADGYARTSGKLGVAFTRTGPGAANSMGPC
jgi:acetolactate synthase-1/2/3 large subunit